MLRDPGSTAYIYLHETLIQRLWENSTLLAKAAAEQGLGGNRTASVAVLVLQAVMGASGRGARGVFLTRLWSFVTGSLD